MMKAIGSDDESTFLQSEAFERREEVSHIFAQKLQTKTFAQWAEIFAAHDIWFTQVNDYDDLAEDPQQLHNGDLIKLDSWNGEEITLVANPVRYDGKRAPIVLPPQKLGAQTAEILDELGIDKTQQQRLHEKGAIGLG